MALTTCHECSGQLSDKAFACPHCGAPTGRAILGGYEYKSRMTILGMPLIHIASGKHSVTGKPRVAKGIIAIGDIACGFLAIGGLSFGGICLGGISFGLVSIGGLAVGLALALGGLAIGGIAVGGMAIGVYAIGGGAFGLHRLSGMEALRRMGFNV